MIRSFLIFLIRAYQLISPFVSFYGFSNCRFQPTCSDYALEALQKKSLLRAIFQILRRVKKCHPWGPCGYDPVE